MIVLVHARLFNLSMFEVYLLGFSGTLLATVLDALTESVDGFEALDGSTTLRISFFCFSASMISAL